MAEETKLLLLLKDKEMQQKYITALSIVTSIKTLHISIKLSFLFLVKHKKIFLITYLEPGSKFRMTCHLCLSYKTALVSL